MYRSGTIIKLLLPRLSTNKTVAYNYNIESTPINNKHIIVVDDEASLTTYLSEYLEQQGFNVSAFNDSKKALSYIQTTSENIDLVITDQLMPNLNGFELSKKNNTAI